VMTTRREHEFPMRPIGTKTAASQAFSTSMGH
jgi:hypothetical protein